MRTGPSTDSAKASDTEIPGIKTTFDPIAINAHTPLPDFTAEQQAKLATNIRPSEAR